MLDVGNTKKGERFMKILFIILFSLSANADTLSDIHSVRFDTQNYIMSRFPECLQMQDEDKQSACIDEVTLYLDKLDKLDALIKNNGG